LFAQGWVLEHPPAQMLPEQLLTPQLCVCCAGHMPFPSQFAARTAVPPVQLADRHDVIGYAQLVRFVPSHEPAQAPPAPAQAPWAPAPFTAEQLPTLPACAHASHWPVQPVSQQTWSAQYPVTHWLALVQVCPAFSLHTPFPSQVLAPLQTPGSSALVTATQVPPPPVQAWHELQDALPQQCASTQFPLVQSDAIAQVSPLVFLQVPVASHDDFPLHVSSTPDFTEPQVPMLPVRLQAWQVPVHAVVQQNPSTQNPLAQSPTAEHVCPVGFFGMQTPPAQ
jgi:hypothetical protein